MQLRMSDMFGSTGVPSTSQHKAASVMANWTASAKPDLLNATNASFYERWLLLNTKPEVRSLCAGFSETRKYGHDPRVRDRHVLQNRNGQG